MLLRDGCNFLGPFSTEAYNELLSHYILTLLDFKHCIYLLLTECEHFYWPFRGAFFYFIFFCLPGCLEGFIFHT